MQITRAPAPLASPLLDAGRRASPGPAAAAEAGGFGGALDQALRAVSASQDQAQRLAEATIRDPGQTSLEESMVAMQKAQIGFQSALHVRNRLVSAYSDIMNMQV